MNSNERQNKLGQATSYFSFCFRLFVVNDAFLKGKKKKKKKI